MEESQSNHGVLKYFNATFLTLISKGKGDDTLNKLRPIALCNVILKIITKVIENGLKQQLETAACGGGLLPLSVEALQ